MNKNFFNNSAQQDANRFFYDDLMGEHEKIKDLIDRTVRGMPSAASCNSLSINSGCALYALFLNEVMTLTGESFYKSIYDYLLRGYDILKSDSLVASLHQGFVGFGWVVSELHNNYEDPWINGFLEELDKVLCDILKSPPKEIIFDIVNGVAGYAVYGISRWRKSRSSEVLDALDEWFIRNHKQFNLTCCKLNSEEKHLDLGMAHGVAGLFSVLGLASREGRLSLAAEERLSCCLTSFGSAAQKNSKGRIIFPFRYGVNCSNRMSWCYGLLSAAIAYTACSHINTELCLRSNELIENCVWHIEHSMSCVLDDPTLCHGKTGGALMFDYFSRQKSLSDEVQNKCRRISAKLISSSLSMECRHVNVPPRFYFKYKDGMTYNQSIIEGSFGVALASLCLEIRRYGNWLNLVGIK